MSQSIAQHIIENLDELGFYEGDTENFCAKNSISYEMFERTRLRFSHIEPIGIGARDLAESFVFQLDSSQISDECLSSST
ncbi:MAG: hypothetical protein Q9M40_12425 [Sulfurimonas sp.]|nr:hypothetical protein [Sulfurimonas sp.]